MTPKLEMWWWMAVCLHLSYGSETCELKFCSLTGWVMTVRICCPLKHLIRWAKVDWMPTADEATWARRKLLSKQSTKLNATEPTQYLYVPDAIVFPSDINSRMWFPSGECRHGGRCRWKLNRQTSQPTGLDKTTYLKREKSCPRGRRLLSDQCSFNS